MHPNPDVNPLFRPFIVCTVYIPKRGRFPKSINNSPVYHSQGPKSESGFAVNMDGLQDNNFVAPIRHNLTIIILGVVIAALVLLILTACYVRYRRHKKAKGGAH